MSDSPQSHDRFLPFKRVSEITGLSRTALWREEQQMRFPGRAQISDRRVGWSEAEVLDWMRARLEHRDWGWHKTGETEYRPREDMLYVVSDGTRECLARWEDGQGWVVDGAAEAVVLFREMPKPRSIPDLPT